MDVSTLKETRQQMLDAGSMFERGSIERDGQSYPAFVHAPKNLVDIIQSGRAHGDKDLFVYEGERWSYNSFYAQVDATHALLVNKFGVQPGDRVCIAMRNYPDWGVVFCATALAGAVSVPLNSWGKTDELLYGMKDSGANILFCDDERYALLPDDAPEREGVQVIVVRVDADAVADGDHALNALTRGDVGEAPGAATVDPFSPAFILYTSGSTGYPKGVPLTHCAVGQTLMHLFFGGALGMALDSNPAPVAEGEPVQEALLLTVPLFHATGLFTSFIIPIQLGAKVVLMRKWHAATALELIEREKISQMASVPALVQSLLSDPAFDQFDTSTLKRIGSGGAATPAGLPELIAEKLGVVTRGTGWGLSETCSVGSTSGGAVYDMCPLSAGLQSAIMDIRTVDGDDNVLPAGEDGELELRGITVTDGYWNRPEATAEATHDGWWRTGDRGHVDDNGYVWITGRIKEIVIRGGENIYPGEIEDAAYERDEVQECVVFGVPDDALGEELVMVYYCREQEPISVDELRAYLKDKLAAFKVPRYIEVTHEPLPQNVSNKLFKRKIRDEFMAREGLA